MVINKHSRHDDEQRKIMTETLEGILRGRWQLIERIGGGGFGEIYSAQDMKTNKMCAIKTESRLNSKEVLRMEAMVLSRLQGLDRVCKFLGCGKTDKVNYIAMTLLGPNLSQLRKQQPNQTFSISTILRLGSQILNVVYSIHNCGFIHRDLKPSNFAMGIGTNAKICYILDFGLARQFITLTGELKQPRSQTGFRGTVRYASINAHLGHELGRHDDLWSLFYMLVELATGELPWKYIQEKENVQKVKQTFDHHKLISSLPDEFHYFLSHLEALNYFIKPDYTYLMQLLDDAMKRLEINQTDPFDWEENTISGITLTSADIIKEHQMRCTPNDDDIPVGSKDDDIDKAAYGDELEIALDQDNKIQVVPSNEIHEVDDDDIPLLSSDQPYVIPLPPVPRPPGYHCSMARMSRYVKCNNPDAVIKKLIIDLHVNKAKKFL
jgi:tau tubulin kinase